MDIFFTVPLLITKIHLRRLAENSTSHLALRILKVAYYEFSAKNLPKLRPRDDATYRIGSECR